MAECIKMSPELRHVPGCDPTTEVETTWCPWDGAEACGSGRDLGTCWDFMVWPSGPRQRLIDTSGVTCPAMYTWPLERRAYSQTWRSSNMLKYFKFTFYIHSWFHSGKLNIEVLSVAYDKQVCYVGNAIFQETGLGEKLWRSKKCLSTWGKKQSVISLFLGLSCMSIGWNCHA